MFTSRALTRGAFPPTPAPLPIGKQAKLPQASAAGHPDATPLRSELLEPISESSIDQ